MRCLSRTPRLGVVSALIGLMCVSAQPAAAQASDALILGVVRDATGAVVSAATVWAHNRSTGNTWTTRTSSAGRYAFVQLPLGGPYDISVQKVGAMFEPRTTPELTLGARIVMDFTLRATATPLATQTIRADADSARRLPINGNRRIDANDVRAIPAAGRNFTDLASLAPTTGAQLSILGQRWTSTDIRIDGVQARNMLRAGEFGAGPFTLSIEALREFDVNAVAYDVATGRQGGGTIRAASKSGTNRWDGSVFSYYRGSSLSAATDFQARDRALRQFDAVQWGGSVGGPLVRDRVHLFMAFDRQDSNEPVFTGLIRTEADERAVGIARDSLTRLTQILSRSYGLDTSRAQIGRLDRRPTANTFFSRLDWTLSNTQRLSLTQNVSAWNSPLSGGVDLPVALREARSNYQSLESQTVLAWRSARASGLQNEFSVAASQSQRRLTPESPLPRGFVRIQSRLADGTNGDTRVQFGGNRLAPDASREQQWQLIDRASWQRGSVLWTLGTDNTLTHLSTYIAESQSGLFEFQSLTDLEAERAFRYSRTLPLTEPAPRTTQSVLELGAYMQAEWHPTSSTTATAGVRWDGTDFLTVPPANALVQAVLSERTDRAPKDWSKLQPRAQLTWNIGGNGSRVLRVGGGRFASQPIYYLQHNQLLNDGSRTADFTYTGAAVPTPDFNAYRANPSRVPGLNAGAASPPLYVNLVDPSFRTPSVWKASVSYQHTAWSWLTLTATVVGSRTTQNYMYLDRNLRVAPAFSLSNENGRPVYVNASTTDAAGRTLNANALVHPELGRVLSLTSNAGATDRAAILDAVIRLPRNARVDASYTNNHARDNSTFGCCLARTATTFTAVGGDPRDLSASWGSSDLDFRHKVVIAGSLPTVFGVRIGGRYVGTNGRPFSAVVNGDINGDEATGNDLAFVFNPDDPSTPAAVATSMRRVLANPNNVARRYLHDNLGRIATRNGVFAPWTERVDVRVEREFATHAGQSVSLSLDVFNAANLINPRWGAEYQLPVGISNQNPVVQRVPLLNVVGFNQTARQYTYTVNENFGVLQKAGNPYLMQLALRYRY